MTVKFNTFFAPHLMPTFAMILDPTCHFRKKSVYNFNHSLDIPGNALINGIFQYVKAWELGPILMPRSQTQL